MINDVTAAYVTPPEAVCRVLRGKNRSQNCKCSVTPGGGNAVIRWIWIERGWRARGTDTEMLSMSGLEVILTFFFVIFNFLRFLQRTRGVYDCPQHPRESRTQETRPLLRPLQRPVLRMGQPFLIASQHDRSSALLPEVSCSLTPSRASSQREGACGGQPGPAAAHAPQLSEHRGSAAFSCIKSTVYSKVTGEFSIS